MLDLQNTLKPRVSFLRHVAFLRGSAETIGVFPHAFVVISIIPDPVCPLCLLSLLDLHSWEIDLHDDLQGGLRGVGWGAIRMVQFAYEANNILPSICNLHHVTCIFSEMFFSGQQKGGSKCHRVIGIS